MVRGMHNRVCVWQGVSMAKEHVWQGVCMTGGVHGKGGHARWGCALQGEYMWQGHAW